MNAGEHIQKEFSKSFLQLVTPESNSRLKKLLVALNEQAMSFLREEGFEEKNAEILNFLEMRYRGQSYELTIPYSNDFVERFHCRHQQLYSYKMGDEACEIVNIRVVAVGKTSKVKLNKFPLKSGVAKPFARSKVFFNGVWQQFNFFNRQDFQPGQTFPSPAVVIDRHSTIIVDANFSGRIDEYKNLLLTRLKNSLKTE